MTINKKIVLIILQFIIFKFIFAQTTSLNYQFEDIDFVKITYFPNPVLGFEPKEYILSGQRDIKIFISFFNCSRPSETSTLVSMIEGEYEIEVFNKNHSESKFKIISGGNYLKDITTGKIFLNERIYFYIQQVIYGDIIKKLAK